MKNVDEFKAWLKGFAAGATTVRANRRMTTRITKSLIEVVDEDGRVHLRIGDIGKGAA